MAEEGLTPGITKFDGSNYAYQRMQMKDFQFSKKLHMLLGSKPEGMKTEEWNLLDRQVQRMIRLTLSRNVTHNMAKENDASTSRDV